LGGFLGNPRYKVFDFLTGRFTRGFKPRVRSKRNFIFIPTAGSGAF
jgi:hypothetical protein